MLQKSGFEVEAVAFERDYHSGRLPDCHVVRLGKIANGKYLQRIFKIAKAMPIIRRAIRRNDVVYALGQDVAAAAFLAGLGLGRPIIMEVGDIVHLQLSEGILGHIVRAIEKYMVNLYKLLVVISPGFLDVYYRQWLKVNTPALLIENKLEAAFLNNIIPDNKYEPENEKPFSGRPLRIGYFGLLRDEWSWLVLEKLASLRPHDFEIIFAGLPVNPIDIPQRVNEYPNMTYKGEYRSPQDLPSLYNSVDMIWACYPYIKENDWNLKWGRPNRFFESCAFRKPCFARAGCHFALDVKQFEIGMLIDDYIIEDVVEKICHIQSIDLVRWQDNLSRLPKSIYMYTTEDDDLASAIRSMKNQ
jgi:hypothetical protein